MFLFSPLVSEDNIKPKTCNSQRKTHKKSKKLVDFSSESHVTAAQEDTSFRYISNMPKGIFEKQSGE